LGAAAPRGARLGGGGGGTRHSVTRFFFFLVSWAGALGWAHPAPGCCFAWSAVNASEDLLGKKRGAAGPPQGETAPPPPPPQIGRLFTTPRWSQDARAGHLIGGRWEGPHLASVEHFSWLFFFFLASLTPRGRLRAGPPLGGTISFFPPDRRVVARGGRVRARAGRGSGGLPPGFFMSPAKLDRGAVPPRPGGAAGETRIPGGKGGRVPGLSPSNRGVWWLCGALFFGAIPFWGMDVAQGSRPQRWEKRLGPVPGTAWPTGAWKALRRIFGPSGSIFLLHDGASGGQFRGARGTGSLRCRTTGGGGPGGGVGPAGDLRRHPGGLLNFRGTALAAVFCNPGQAEEPQISGRDGLRAAWSAFHVEHHSGAVAGLLRWPAK